METLNEELIRKLRDGELLLEYGASTTKEDLEKLRSIVAKAFPKDRNSPYGNAKYYRTSVAGVSWTGTDSVSGYDTIVPMADFFKPSEVNINYQIF